MKALWLLLCVNSLAIAQAIYIVPFQGFEKTNSLFDPMRRDNCMQPFCDLRRALEHKGHTLSTSALKQPLPSTSTVVFFDIYSQQQLQMIDNIPYERRILFLWEPPTVSLYIYNKILHKPFCKIYTMLDQLIDNVRYFKFYYPQPSLIMHPSKVPFKEKKLCTLIACNKFSSFSQQLYTARKDTIDFFEQHAPQDFVLHGIGWPSTYATYGGPIANKTACMHAFKFCICYENTHNLSGYVTEKIFDCFVAGCVPVYWGADNITDYVPAECFIDRRNFATNQALYEFLCSITEQEHAAYLDAIRKFLSSDRAHLFSTDYFIETFLQAISHAEVCNV